MRKMKIDWSDLGLALDSSSWEFEQYLDVETGKIVMITDDIRRQIEDPDPDFEPAEWEKELIEEAKQVEENSDSRYLVIPHQDSHEGYRDMERFIATVRDRRLQDRLERAIQGRGAFRRFRDTVSENPEELKRWNAYSERCDLERMVDWLESEGIEPINPPELPEVPESVEPQPDDRKTVLEELTLLLLYLSSWEEEPIRGSKIRKAWKGYLFEVLNALEEKGFLSQSRRAKSLTLSEEGIRQAQELEEQYLVDPDSGETT